MKNKSRSSDNHWKILGIFGSIVTVTSILDAMYNGNPIPWTSITACWIVGYFVLCFYDLFDESYEARDRDERLDKKIDELKNSVLHEFNEAKDRDKELSEKIEELKDSIVELETKIDK